MMGVFGKYWEYLGNDGSIWEMMGVFGKYWEYLGNVLLFL